MVFQLPQYRHSWRFRSKGVSEQKVALTNTMPVSNASVIRRAALEGLGIAMLSGWITEKDIADGGLIDLFPGYEFSALGFDTAAWALHKARGYLPAKIQVFIEYLMT